MYKSKKSAFSICFLFLLPIATFIFFSGPAHADTSFSVTTYVNGLSLTRSPHNKIWQEGSNKIVLKENSSGIYYMYINGIRAARFVMPGDMDINGSYQWDGNTAVFFLSTASAGMYCSEGLVVFRKNGHVSIDRYAFGGVLNPVIMKSSPKALRVRLIDSGGGVYRYYRYALSDDSVTKYEKKLVHVGYRYISADTDKVFYLQGRVMRKLVTNGNSKEYEAVLVLDPRVTFYNGTFYFPKKYIYMGSWSTSKYGWMVKPKNSWFRAKALPAEDIVGIYHIRPAMRHPRSPGFYKTSENY